MDAAQRNNERLGIATVRIVTATVRSREASDITSEDSERPPEYREPVL